MPRTIIPFDAITLQEICSALGVSTTGLTTAQMAAEIAQAMAPVAGPVVERKWVADTEWREKLAHAPVLVQGDQLLTVPYYLSYQNIERLDEDGVVTLGGKCVNAASIVAFPWLWGDGSASVDGHLWACTQSATRVKVTYSGKVGTFTVGEEVTQEASGAKGYVIRDDGTYLYLLKETGTFAAESTPGDHTITGGASGATCETTTVSTSGSWITIHRAPDSASDFVPEMDLTAGACLKHSLCIVKKTDGTKVALWFEYINSGNACIYYNYPDTNHTWTLLMQADTGAIAHFHGGVFFEDIGGVSGANKLIVMTGDTDDGAGLLVCADIDDLLANPATWKTRWGLDKSGATRTTWLTSGGGAAYCWGTGQQCRVLDFARDPDGATAWFCPDSSALAQHCVRKVNLSTGVITTTSATGIYTGSTFNILMLDSGELVMSTSTELSGTSTYISGQDNHAHLYLIGSGGTTAEELMVHPRNISPPPSDNSVKYHAAIVEFPVGSNRVWLGVHPTLHAEDDTAYSGLRGGSQCGRVAPTWPFGEAVRAWPMQNFVKDPTVDHALLTDWTNANYCTMARDTASAPSALGGRACLSCTPYNTGSSIAWQLIGPTRTGLLAGKVVTVSVWVLWNPADSGQTGQVHFVTTLSGVTAQVLGIALIASQSARWQQVELACRVPVASAAYDGLALKLYSRVSGAYTSPIYWWGASVVAGMHLGEIPAGLSGWEGS